jgi:hypothetical protein
VNIDLLSIDPLEFIHELTVSTSAGPRRFGDVIAPFQADAFHALAPSLVAVAEGTPPPIPRAWLERTKGASKDSDLACCLLWLLAFSPRPLRIQIAANDSEQADEIRLIIRGLLRLEGELNELLGTLLTVQGDRIINTTTQSYAQILTRDSKGGHGSRPDVLIVNELTHIQDEEYASTCFDNLDKMPAGLGIIACNSGFSPSWQERWKAIAVSQPRWWVQEYRVPAPWVSAADLAESELRNSRSRFRRLWHGEWASGGGDAIDASLIQAACTLDGPRFALPDGMVAVCGVDLGIRKDSSCVVVLGVSVGRLVEGPPREQPVKSSLQLALEDIGPYVFDNENEPLYRHDPFDEQPEQTWEAGDEAVNLLAARTFTPLGVRSHIDLSVVERAIVDLHRAFRLSAVYCDTWQAALLVTRLISAGIPAQGIDPTAPNLREQASVVLDGFREKRFKLFQEPTLLADIGRWRLVEKSYGVRLESPVGIEGEGTRHGDSASAFALAALAAHRMRGMTPQIALGGAPLICWP